MKHAVREQNKSIMNQSPKEEDGENRCGDHESICGPLMNPFKNIGVLVAYDWIPASPEFGDGCGFPASANPE